MDYETIDQDKHDEFVRQESRYDAIDAMNDAIWKEFIQSYSDNDLLTEFCDDNKIILTPETLDDYDEDDFEEFKQHKFYEYKEQRL